MPYLVTLDNYTPSARLSDAGVWTQARYQYAASRQGSWTTILTENLSPVDTDPTLPLTRDLDVIVPDLGYPGWLRVVFIDAGGNQEPTEPVYVGSAIRPTVLEVANLMPDRTTIQGGAEAGTFTTGTTPTATQVDALIDLVIDTVGPRVGPDADGEVQRAARSIVALQTAILAEATYFSHQGDVNDRRIEVWQSLIEQHMVTLNAAANDNLVGGVRAYGTPITTTMTVPYTDPAGILP
jgi:hypothetical protein